MQTSQVVSQLRRAAQRTWQSRNRRAAVCGGILLLLCSLGLGAALLHNQQRQQSELAELHSQESGEIEMEVDARGGWQRPPPPVPAPPIRAVQEDTARAEAIRPPQEVNAAWYDVPDDSLAKRRAGQEELTAAHNRLPIGTVVRVTHLSNGKSTLVRITDRGIRDKKVKLDICREAAEELGMVSKGIGRVKMEIVREEGGSSAPESHQAAAQH